MTDIPTTRRWVATQDSAKYAAGALVGLTLRRRGWWVYVGVVELALALWFGLALDERHGTVTRLLWGPAYALLPTLGIATVALAAAYLLSRRMFRRRLRAGVVLESGIGKRALVLRGPWAQSTLSFDGIASVRTSGHWVFLQQVGSPMLNVWPAELFPPADLARLEQNLATRTS